MAERYLKRKADQSKRKFFFIDRRLYKILMVNKPANLVEAWSFEEEKTVTFLYSDFKKKADKAFRTKEAGRILNVSKDTMIRAWQNGHIREPVRSNSLKPDALGNRNAHWWGLWNILEAWEYLMTVHYGRPRHDGKITPNQNLPTRHEVIARVNDQVVLYTTEDAEYYVRQYDPPNIGRQNQTKKE